MAKVIVEVRGLVNAFGAQVVHDGLDMDILEGEVFGVVGGSGSGKSVLLRTILGLQRPKAGSIKLNGRDITALSWEELKAAKAGYGVTFQSGALYTALTVRQNVQMPMIEHLRLPKDALDELADVKLRLVGLPADAGDKFPSQLSGGMVKRAALARALALDPPLLFLDEPTAGLDPIGAEAFDELVMGLREQLSLTVMLITHDLDTLFRTCNRVGVIVDKRMISGTLAEIATNRHRWIQDYFHGERAERFGAAKHGA